MTRAAARVHVSQPALSRQIALLEEELGIALFDRVRQRIHLTDGGRFFLTLARQLLHDADAAAQQLREKFALGRPALRLGFIGPFLDDLVAPAVGEFLQGDAGARVSLHELPPQEQLERLSRGELDAGVLGNLHEADRHRFMVRPLSRHRMAAVVAAGHRLAGRGTIRLAELAQEDWVSLSNAHYPGRREFLLECCAEAGFEPRIAVEPDTLPLMLAAIATGSGVGLIPDHARKLPHAGCVFLRLEAPEPCTRLLLVTPKAGAPAGLDALASLLITRAAALADA